MNWWKHATDGVGNKMGNKDDLCSCVRHGEGQRGLTRGTAREKGH